MLNFKSYADLAQVVHNNLPIIAAKNFDLIVGVPRSGIIPAYMIALDLNISVCSFSDLVEDKPLKNFSTRKLRNIIKRPSDAKNILIVEDSYNTGRRIPEQKKMLSSDLLSKVTFMAVYSSVEDPAIDFYLEMVPQPRVFEWNIFHHEGTLAASCFDMDGVLCEDPTDAQNDDGARYVDFIKTAKPKYIPTHKVGSIVTSRLEKYRSQTEEWLRVNGVRYDTLLMLDGYTAEERRRKSVHAPFKAQEYRNEKYKLFIESSLAQAQLISNISGKPVYCTDANKMIYSVGEAFESSLQGTLKKYAKKHRHIERIIRPSYRLVKRLKNKILA